MAVASQAPKNPPKQVISKQNRWGSIITEIVRVLC